MNEIYEMLRVELKRFACSLCQNEYDADDLIQETFLKTLPYIQLLQTMHTAQKKSWLMTTMRRIWIDRYRKIKREELESVLEKIGLQGQEEMGFSAIETRELLEYVPKKYVDVVYMKYWLGMNSREIARCKKVPDATVRTWLRKGLQEVRKRLVLESKG